MLKDLAVRLSGMKTISYLIKKLKKESAEYTLFFIKAILLEHFIRILLSWNSSKNRNNLKTNWDYVKSDLSLRISAV